MKRLAILGSTGSIGTQTLQVIEAHPDLFCAEVLTANRNVKLLAEQAIRFKPNMVVIAEENKYAELKEALKAEDIKVYAGKEALSQVVAAGTVDMVVTGYRRLQRIAADSKCNTGWKSYRFGEQRNFGCGG